MTALLRSSLKTNKVLVCGARARPARAMPTPAPVRSHRPSIASLCLTPCAIAPGARDRRASWLLPPRVQAHVVVARGGRRQQPADGIPNAAVSAPHLAIALREAARVPLQCRITASAVLSFLITPEVARCVCAGEVRTTHEAASVSKIERAARRARARHCMQSVQERAGRGATVHVQRNDLPMCGVCVDGVNCATARETRLGI